MPELITRPQADLLCNTILVLGIVVAAGTAIYRHGKGDSLRPALRYGAPLVVVGILWHIYNTITDHIGLGTVANLLVNLAVFVVVGVGCGFAWQWGEKIDKQKS